MRVMPCVSDSEGVENSTDRHPKPDDCRNWAWANYQQPIADNPKYCRITTDIKVGTRQCGYGRISPENEQGCRVKSKTAQAKSPSQAAAPFAWPKSLLRYELHDVEG